MNVFRRVWEAIKQMFFNPKTINDALRVTVLTTQDEIEKVKLWHSICDGDAPWQNKDTPSLGLARSVCAEVSRNVVIELESEIQGNDYLNEQYQRVIDDLRDTIEKVCAVGGIVFRPFVFRDKILVNVAEAGTYFPIRFAADGTMESVVFTEKQRQNDKDYVLFTLCNWTEGTYTVTNTAWELGVANALGKPVNLTVVEAWKDLEPSAVFYGTSRPWFVPLTAPNGEAVFSRAIDLIRLADEQDARTTKEFINGRSRIVIDRDLLERDENGNLKESVSDVFEGVDHPDIGVTIFNPELRIAALKERTEQIKRQIEIVCGLSFGILSEPAEVERTATDIKHGRQRFFVTVSSYQHAAQTALEALAVVLNEISVAYKFQSGYTDISFDFGDSVLTTEEEKEAEIDRRMNIMQRLQGIGVVSPAETRAAFILYAGFMPPEEAIAEAEKTLPEQEPDDEFSGKI